MNKCAYNIGEMLLTTGTAVGITKSVLIPTYQQQVAYVLD